MVDVVCPEPSDLPRYGGSVFISYARADDEKPPFEDAVQGWVTFFWHQLRWELTDAGVHQAKLWRDRYEIEPAEIFSDKIEAALRGARLFVPILSPNWVQREWCIRELRRFCEFRAGKRDPHDGIVPVIKMMPPEEDIPPQLANREGYRFYEKDATGKVREFYWRGLQDRQAYLEQVKRVADWIAGRLLAAAPERSRNSKRQPERIVFVAASTDELRDARQRLVNDLRRAGYTVVPEDGYLPDTHSRAEQAIRDLVTKAETSVHLLGASEGSTPDGGTEAITRLQLRLAREHADRATGSFPRILWAPKWLPSAPSEKRDPFEVIQKFGGIVAGEEVYAEDVTGLSQWLRGRLDGPRGSEGAATQLLVVSAAACDDGLASTLANRLQGGTLRVRPFFADDSLPDAEGPALVPWGDAALGDVGVLLEKLLGSQTRVILLQLPGGEEQAKRRFFREGVYAERLTSLPADRKAARDLLAQLEIFEP